MSRLERIDRRSERAVLLNRRLHLLAGLAGGPLAYVRGALGIVFDPATGRLCIVTGRFQ